MTALIDLLPKLAASDRGATGRLLAAADAGLAAVRPAGLVEQALVREPGGVRAGGRLVKCRGMAVLAVGKAARGMAEGADRALGDVISRGLAVADQPGPVPRWARLAVGDHPLPGPGSAGAGRAAANLVETVQKDEVLLALISGGGSALLEYPRAGVGLEDIRALNRGLLRSRAPIEAINRLRTALSDVKGGRLGRRCRGRIITLVISDVEGDPATVSSGPTVLPPPPGEAGPSLESLLLEYGIDRALDDLIRKVAAREDGPDGPLSRVRPWGEDVTAVLADGEDAGRAAADFLTGAGLDARLHPDRWTGNTMRAAEEALEATPAGQALVFRGETTLQVTGGGRGGRNQQAALAAAIRLAGTPYRFLAVGTDGVDGPTDAAGAVVDGATAGGAGAEAARRHLERCDAYPFLEKAGALLKPGRTGANVADLWIADKTGR